MSSFRSIVSIVILSVAALSAAADEPAILAELKAFFETPDGESGAALAVQREIAERILADSAFDRTRLSGWLHAAALFRPFEPGRHTLTAVGLEIVLRVPAGYDPRRPWPLIYALHGTGGGGDQIIEYTRKLLGDAVDEYIIAAPVGYRQVVVHANEPYSAEHAALLREVRRNLHLDANRTFALGYSRGGHACWTLAVLEADLFAGVVPLAGTLILQEWEKLFEVFLPNARTTRVLSCWGKGDTAGTDMLSRSPQGGIAGINRTLFRVAESLKLPATGIEDPEAGHGGIVPPADALTQLLASTRDPWPDRIDHHFRVLEQGAPYWIESKSLQGALWNTTQLKIEFKPGENSGDPAVEREAVARAIRGLLCRVQGERDGQKIKVTRKKVTDLIVWLGDPELDFVKPVTLTVNGEKLFDAIIEPDLLLCLTQARRDYDFDHLRWAGLRVKSGKKAAVVRPGDD